MKCETCESNVDELKVKVWKRKTVCPSCFQVLTQEPPAVAELSPAKTDVIENTGPKSNEGRRQIGCDICGRVPAISICFTAAVGRVLFSITEEYGNGFFCKECGLKLYHRAMKRHLANTWFSPTSLIFGSTVVTASNLVKKQSLEQLADPHYPAD